VSPHRVVSALVSHPNPPPATCSRDCSLVPLRLFRLWQPIDAVQPAVMPAHPIAAVAVPKGQYQLSCGHFGRWPAGPYRPDTGLGYRVAWFDREHMSDLEQSGCHKKARQAPELASLTRTVEGLQENIVDRHRRAINDAQVKFIRAIGVVVVHYEINTDGGGSSGVITRREVREKCDTSS